MKKYIILAIGGIFFLVLLFSFYQKSESSMTENRQNVLNLFLTAKKSELTLEKDIIKSRNFLSLTYDLIVEDEKEVDQICLGLNNPLTGIKNINKQLDDSINDYCKALDKKMIQVETFKSKNAILKNSTLYLQKIALEDNYLVGNKNLKEEELRNQLVKMSLAYSVAPNNDLKEALQKIVDNLLLNNELTTSNEDDLEMIVSHVSRILENKDNLDVLVKNLVSSNTEVLLDKVRQNYFVSFSKSEDTALIFKKLLFGVCLMFLFFTMYNIILLWKSANTILIANQTLESRVIERTKQLNESKETIIQQQQALISSAKMSSLGEMAGGIAHEINTPLAIIGMRVEQLEECVSDGTVNTELVLKTTQIIKNTNTRIAKIIAGLRFFARDSKTMPTQMESVSKILADTFSFCKEKFSIHGIQLEITKNIDPSIEIDCRPVEISQVVLNLLNNSFDAIEEFKEKWIKVSLTDLGDLVEIRITDSGQGIPKDLQDKIMQPFFTTKDVGKGTGLGLSISKGIIESHQGKFVLDNNSPNTCFVLLLPKKQQEKSQEELKEVS